MVITELEIKSYKSFGNNPQTIRLNSDRGELVLLVGMNGAGKSSLLESFEYTLYGKVKSGKSKKWHKLGTLPNRINGGLANRIKFLSKNVEVEVRRGIGPNHLDLLENGVANERAGKANIDDRIEDYVGMDVETFKSFISLSINDFKNFISLTNEEKQLLLDRLFNLEVINVLNGILKELAKANNIRRSSLDSEIQALAESIESIRESVRKAVKRELDTVQTEIDQVRRDMDGRREDWARVKDKIKKISEKKAELEREVENERQQASSIANDIRNVKRDIELYDSGKCPTCATSFDGQFYSELRDSLRQRMQALTVLREEVEANVTTLRERQRKLRVIEEEANESHTEISFFLKSCKQKLDKLEAKARSEDYQSDNLEEFNQTIRELEQKKERSGENLQAARDKETYYKELAKVFGEDGVKKSIIAGLIKPINHFIRDYSKKMDLRFDISIDETFTAEVRHLGEAIDHETLSTGENKRINLIILMAYITLIRTKKFINILFLDEVFSSIDLEGIDDILRLLKSFANDNKINIFVVHHAILKQENFDRIIKVNKEIFTYLEEVDLTQ